MENVVLVLTVMLGVLVLIVGLLLMLGAARTRNRRLTEMASEMLDKLNALDTKVDGLVARVEEDVQAQRDEIARLEAIIANRPLTAEEQEVYDRLVAKVDALDPLVAATLKPEHSKRKKSKG